MSITRRRITKISRIVLGKRRKLSEISRLEELNLIIRIKSQLLYCDSYICEKRLKFVIDSKASINVISKTAFRELEITDQPKINFYGLIAVDGSRISRQNTVNKKIRPLKVRIQ